MQITEMKENFEHQMEEIKEEQDFKIKELVVKLEVESKQKDDYYIELQRLKGETNNLYEGGFGTFTLAFENPYYNQLL